MEKQWKKENELKGLKSKLAAIDRKIQLELAKDNEPQQGEKESVSNSDEVQEETKPRETPSNVFTNEKHDT